MKTRLFLPLAVLLCALCFQAAGQTKIKVACIGNSITAGSRIKIPEKDSYPAVLQTLLGNGYEVRNFGRSGRTALSNGNSPYVKTEQYTESQAFQPDIVTIKLGTNDSKPVNWDTHAAEFEGDLRAMVETYRNLESKPKIYLCFPIWVTAANGYKIREEVIASEIIPTINKVAAETGVSVIDLHTTLYGMPQLIPDTVHPNELGAVLIANAIYQRIK